MAVAPLTYLEKKWAAGYQGQSNSLIKAATQTTDRPQVETSIDQDTHRTISGPGRSVLRMMGWFLYNNCSPVRGAVDEITRLAVATHIPQFYVADRKWGRNAEEWLYENDKFVDVRGWPHTMRSFKKNLVREAIVGGELGILLADLEGGAKIQTWRSHRIGGRRSNHIVVGGEYDGATVIDGSVINEIGKTIAYGLTDGNQWSDPFTYVSANDFIRAYIPSVSDQYGGLSMLGCAAYCFFDWDTAQSMEQMAQNINSTIAVSVKNESGTVDKAKALLRTPATVPDSTGAAQSLPVQIHKPGTVMYFKAGTGQGIEEMKLERPSSNYQAYQEEILRSALSSMGWSFDFAHNPTKAGGAQMRIVIEKIEARLDEIREFVDQVCARIDGWRISKAIKAGYLDENPEWYKIEYQHRARLTADRKYDSEIDLAETARGMMTDRKACGNRGDYRDDVYDEKELEVTSKWERAGRLANAVGITIQEAYSSMWEDNPNGIKASTPTDGGATAETETATE